MKKVVFITGGSRGIGKAMVVKFKEEGWSVATCATSEERAIASGADYGFACDVSQLAEVKRAIELVKYKMGHLDVLINNAGIVGTDSLDPEVTKANGEESEKSLELYHKTIAVNLHGTYYMCKYALPHLPDEQGRIINIGSVLSLTGSADSPAYAASKHAVLGLTRSIALAVAGKGITVNAICPTWVNTDMARERWAERGISPEKVAASMPQSRVIEPDEVADLAYFLTTHSARGITGQALPIDGGTLA
jgi:NAD(P)-dependent dehydrogenase (short-subunit alcohol dehydrogenase family)